MSEKLFDIVEDRFQLEVATLGERIVNPAEFNNSFHELEAYYHIVLVGVAGAGKTTVVNHLESRGAFVLPTVTTRPRRNSDGMDRINVSEVGFQSMLERDEFLFWHYTNGHLQGFPRQNVEMMRSCHPCIVDKSIPSVHQLTGKLPCDVREKTAFVYLRRPSLHDNLTGLSHRTGSDFSEERAMCRIAEEVAEIELLRGVEHQLTVVNDDLDATLSWFEGLGSLQLQKDRLSLAAYDVGAETQAVAV